MKNQEEPEDELEQAHEDLVRLHKAICKGLADKAEGDELTPQELKEARQLLLDNQVRLKAPGFGRGGKPRLVEDLPFRAPDEEGGEEYLDRKVADL